MGLPPVSQSAREMRAAGCDPKPTHVGKPMELLAFLLSAAAHARAFATTWQSIGGARGARENAIARRGRAKPSSGAGPWRAPQRSRRKNRPIAICHLASLPAMCD
jgi:hypothetical protein